MLGKFKTKKSFERFITLAILSSIIILVCSSIKYIIFGSVTFDEPIQKLGLNEHLNFAADILQGERRSYKSMFSVTEYYGAGLKLIYIWPMLILQNLTNIGNKNFLEFISFRGFALFIYISTGIFLYYTSNFYQKNKSKIFALIYFTFPLLAGESYINIKDIPFAICFTFYSLFNGILVIKNKSVKEKKLTEPKIVLTKKSFFENTNILQILSTFSAALLINSKASIIAPIIIIETVLSLYISDIGLDIYRNFINLTKKFIVRLFAILGFTYLITPAGWIEPFRYYKEVVKAFSRWSGTYESRIGGVEFATNTDSWNLFEYLWRWVQIKIPLIMIILVFIFISLFIYKLISRKGRYKNEAIFNPILIFYGLQLVLTPAIAIAANSSSYDALRHWCFLYPPLIVFSAYVVDNYLLNSKNKKFNIFSKFVVIFFTVLANIDNVLMMPYSNISFNTYGRRFVNYKNTETDYWGYSAGELLKKKVSNGYQIRSPEAPYKMNTAHTPYHVKNKNHKYLYAYGTGNKDNYIKIEKNCKNIQTVSRKLLFRKDPIIFSKIGICPIHKGDKWEIWSTSSGEIKVEYYGNKSSLILPNEINSFGLKRVKEENNNNQVSLSMLFFDNGEFTIEKVLYAKNQLNHSSYNIPQDEDIKNYLNNFVLPQTILPLSNHSFEREWELGFKNSESKIVKIYKDNQVKIFSINNQFIGISCDRKKRRPFRTILKDKSGELIVRGLDSLKAINNPDIKPGVFHINKVDCIFDKEDNLEKIFVYDSNKFTTYKWEIDLNGNLIESKQVKTTTSKIQRNYKSEWEMGIDNSEIKPEPFFKNENIELVSIDKNYVGIICKIKNKKDFRTLLKDKSGNLIFKPNGKSGDFSIKKGDCVFNDSSKLEKVFLYDTNGDVTYRWEIDLNGIVLKSEQIKS